MSYRDDPRWQDAQARYVSETNDDESPDQAFARRAVAAYEMWLIQLGRAVPATVTEAQALVAYAFTALHAFPTKGHF